MKLISPVVKVRFGDYLFTTGDGSLMGVSVTLGEDARASRCSISLNDPGMILAGTWFKMSFDEGGIQVPSDLLGPPAPAGGAPGAITGGSSPLNPPNGQGGPAILSRPSARNQAGQSAYYQQAWDTMSYDPAYSGKLDQAAQQAIANKARYQAIVQGTSVPWEFVAATHYRESTFNFNKHLHNGDPLNRPTTREPAGRGPFGSFEESARDALFSLKGLQRVSDWSVSGMAWQLERYNGLGYAFKGRPSPYLFAGSQHYAGGKYVADGRYNPNVKDQQLGTMTLIARIRQLEGGAATPSPAPTPAPEPTPTPTPEGADKPLKEKTKPPEVSKKGREILVSLGFTSFNQAIAYHFIHTGTTATGRNPDKVDLEGQSVRWKMARRRKNATFEDLTLRELALQVCKSHGLTLEMEGDGPKYAFLDQTGISDYELLLRECQAIGYRIYEKGNALKIGPWRADFTGFIITPEMAATFQFSDRAQQELQKSEASTSASVSETPAGETKVEIDRLTGQPKQVRDEDKTDAGKDSTTAVTGGDRPRVSGNTKPKDSTQVASVASVEVSRGAEAVEAKTKQVLSAAQKKEAEEKATAAAAKQEQAQAVERDQLAVSEGGIPSEAWTGLPSQKTGAIDLADGTAEAEAIKDEARRVKSYESSATFKTTPAALTITPGSIIAIARECFADDPPKDAFASEWRVSQVTHDFNAEPSTTLQFYKPQKAKDPAAQPATPVSGPVAPVEGAISANGAKLQNPCPGFVLTSRFGPRWGRMHKGVDLGTPTGTPVHAAGDGVITVASCGIRGYGCAIYMDHGTTYGKRYGTRYAHLNHPKGLLVKVGQQVKQGQVIAQAGNTGVGTGPHLHFEVRVGGPSGTAIDPLTVCVNFK